MTEAMKRRLATVTFPFVIVDIRRVTHEEGEASRAVRFGARIGRFKVEPLYVSGRTMQWSSLWPSTAIKRARR